MIKKIMSFMMLLAAVSFTACINDDEVNEEVQDEIVQNGDENVSFQFVVPNVGEMRTATAETTDVLEAGIPDEYKLYNAKIYLFNAKSGNFYKSFSPVKSEIGDPIVDNNSVTYKEVSYKIKAGTYKVFVVTNIYKELAPANVNELLQEIDSETYNDVDINFVGKGIMMTNRGAQAPTVTIEADKTTKVTISLERVLAKIALKKTQHNWELKDAKGDTYVTITPSNYNMVNLSKDFYLFRHVGVLPLADETPAAPASWDISTNFGVIADVNGYAFDPHFFEKTVAAAPTFDGSRIFNNPIAKSVDTNFSYPGTFNDPGKYVSVYCLGNTNFRPAQLQTYTTGILIAANMTIPSDHAFNADGTNIDMENAAPTELYYFNYNFYRDLNAVNLVGKATIPTDPVSDDVLWKDYQIKHFKTHQGSYKCFYNTWIRHLNNGKPTYMGVMEFAIVRNNIYKVNVNNVLGLGDGTPNVDPTPDENDGYLDIDYSIMPWIVRDQDVPLGE